MLRLCAAAAICAVICGPALADVTYTFDPTSYSGPWGGDTVALSFSVSQAAVSAGSVSEEQYQRPFALTGSGLDAFSATLPGNTHLFEGVNGGTFGIAATFGPGGALDSVGMFMADNPDSMNLTMSGDTATFTTELYARGCETATCSVSGTWAESGYVPVPEPGTLALLGAGLAAFGIALSRGRAGWGRALENVSRK